MFPGVSVCARRWLRPFWYCCALSACALAFGVNAAPVAAATLHEAVIAALRNDPVLLAAAAQHRAEAEISNKTRADLLPTLTFQMMRSKNRTEEFFQLPGGTDSPTTTTGYDSERQSLVLTQPLIRPRSWIAFLQGRSTVSAADATYEAARQQAIDRVVAAYAEKLRRHGEVMEAKTALTAAEFRLRYVQGLMAAEKTSRVELREAEAALIQGRARVQVASASLAAADNDLGRLTGLDWREETSLPMEGMLGVAEKIVTAIEAAFSVHEPLEVEKHPLVMARKFQFEAASREILKRQSDYAPTLDLMASHAEGDSASDTAIGQHATTRAIGVMLNVSLFSGGLTAANVREAKALRDKAEQEFRNARLVTANDRSRTEAQLKANLELLKASIATADAADLSVRRVEQGIAGGLYSEVDLKEALARKTGVAANLTGTIATTVGLYSQFLAAQGVLDIEDLLAISYAF